MDEYDAIQNIRLLKKIVGELSIELDELQRKRTLAKLLAETNDSTVSDENGETLIFEKRESKKHVKNTMAFDLDKVDISRELALLEDYNRKEKL